MPSSKIYIESRVLGFHITSKLIHHPFILSHENCPPVIYQNSDVGLFEQLQIGYSEFLDGAKIFDATCECWADRSDNKNVSTIRWGSPGNTYLPQIRNIGKIVIQADRFFYWDEDDPGSTTELINPILTLICTPDMRMMNQFTIKVNGFTRNVASMYWPLECMHSDSKILRSHRNQTTEKAAVTY